MGPIELVFLVMIALFGIVGVVRGYARELGVTTMLLIGLLVLVFIDKEFHAGLVRFLAALVGDSTMTQATTKALIFCVFLTIIIFISYQGETLSFPGRGANHVFGLGAGLLNGYLYAGSLWYYLGNANWPLLNISEPYSQFYQLAWNVLPPNILPWPYLIGLAAFMLIMRVLK